MLGDKLRFRFAKTGTLRLLSHHDLMRCFERILRRTGLPFKSTGGFHPTPRIVFALSLTLGAEGLDEAVEIEFDREVESETALATLNAQSPPGLMFTRVGVVPMKATARARRVVFTLDLPADRRESAEAACRTLLAEPCIWVDRFKPTPKQLNIRPYLRGLTVSHAASEPTAHMLSLDFWVTQTGTARAEELLRLLNMKDLLDEGSILRRAVLELRDEITGADPADEPPDGPAETLPLAPGAAAAADRDREPPSITAHWGATLAGPVVE